MKFWGGKENRWTGEHMNGTNKKKDKWDKNNNKQNENKQVKPNIEYKAWLLLGTTSVVSELKVG